MSRNRQMVSRERPDWSVATGPPPQAERFPLDYASWRAHLAAPGSFFESAESPSPSIVHFDAATHLAASTNHEQHAA
jgi:hypothetical protein